MKVTEGLRLIKLFKIITVVLALSFLQACVYQSVNSWDIERAVKACGGIENIVEIYSHFDGKESVICKNGNQDWLR